MKTLSREEAVGPVARASGLVHERNPGMATLAHCLRTIRKWTQSHPRVTTIADLQDLLCMKLGLVFEEIWSDNDLDAIIAKYVAKGEGVFLYLKHEMNASTYAALLRREHGSDNAHDRHVAVIDCRGMKAARRFFSRWHEIAHLLTFPQQLDFPFHRSTRNGDPRESLIDQIAGHIGFYEPLFGPVLQSELVGGRPLNFGAVENIRARFCPAASFQATLIACVKAVNSPVLYLEVAMGYRRGELARWEETYTTSLDARPEPKLRARTVVPNEAAREAGLVIHRNMQIPEHSMIREVFLGPQYGQTANRGKGPDNLRNWLHSDGTSLRDIDVTVEARRSGDTAICIVTPLPNQCPLSDPSGAFRPR